MAADCKAAIKIEISKFLLKNQINKNKIKPNIPSTGLAQKWCLAVLEFFYGNDPPRADGQPGAIIHAL
jgi:hypothetical protein